MRFVNGICHTLAKPIIQGFHGPLYTEMPLRGAESRFTAFERWPVLVPLGMPGPMLASIL